MLFKDSTRKARTLMVAVCLRILTPNLYQDLKKAALLESDEYVHAFNFRPSTVFIRKSFGDKPLIGIEIGTGYGCNAIHILHKLNIKRLYCIDPLLPYTDGDGTFKTNSAIKSEQTRRMLSLYDNITFIRKSSSEAVNDIRGLNEPIDFVYIDGNHTYEYAIADMQNYYPLLRQNGILAGHDINWFSVRKALMDFCKQNSINPIIKTPDWIIIKHP
jgi:hypothetical protein